MSNKDLIFIIGMILTIIIGLYDSTIGQFFLIGWFSVFVLLKSTIQRFACWLEKKIEF